MNRIKKFRLVAIAAAAAALVVGVLTGCTSVATPEGMCGWVVGNGENGTDRKIHDTVYENQNPNYSSSSENVHYVPCGPRNFRVTDGSELDQNGKPIGDLTTPFEVQTSDKTPVYVQVDAFWQLNQESEAFNSFKELCNKYPCYTTDTTAGQENFATPGWNGLLQENFSPAMRDAAKAALRQIPDAIWQDNDPELYAQAGELMSQAFMEEIAVTTGYSVDLFCGSGNSDWTDPENPGAEGNEFDCTNVRFDVREVEPVNKKSKENASVQSQEELQTGANKSRFNSSQPLYGDQTSFWLGVQDSLAKCPAESTCNVYLGNIPQ